VNFLLRSFKVIKSTAFTQKAFTSIHFFYQDSIKMRSFQVVAVALLSVLSNATPVDTSAGIISLAGIVKAQEDNCMLLTQQ
jgi:hypothetical protein